VIATTHDWAPLLARRVRVHDSGGAIAAILSQANATDIITLSGGAPAAKTFPDEVPSKLTDKVLSSGSATALQYSPTQGLPSVRDAIAAPAGRDGGAVAGRDRPAGDKWSRTFDVLVNNAGASRPGRFETLTDEAWQGDMDVKLFSQIRCSRATLPPHVRASSAARIVNINAIDARYPDPTFFATTVNRAACLNFSKVLAIELGPENILVNSVDIGFVLTPQWENIRKRRSPKICEEEFFTRCRTRRCRWGGSEAPTRCRASWRSWHQTGPAT